MKQVVIVLLLSGLSFAATGKVLDVAPYYEQGTPIIAPNNGHPVLIGTGTNMFALTVAVDGIAYTANFRAHKGFRPIDIIVGDPIEASVQHERLIVTTANGKVEKSNIVRRARVQSVNVDANDPLHIR